MAIKLPNPKYIPKPYEKMAYPGQRVQIDVKYVPQACLVGEAVNDAAENGGHYYQYTFIDEYSRFRYLEAFKEHNSYSSAEFIRHCVKKFPYAIECVQTDNGAEFTTRMSGSKKERPTLFQSTLEDLGIRHKLIKVFTPRHNGKVERSHRKDNEYFYASHKFFSFQDFQKQLSGSTNTTTSPCVPSTGAHPNRSFLLSPMCNTSLTNLQFRLRYQYDGYPNSLTNPSRVIIITIYKL